MEAFLAEPALGVTAGKPFRVQIVGNVGVGSEGLIHISCPLLFFSIALQGTCVRVRMSAFIGRSIWHFFTKKDDEVAENS